MNDNNMFSVTFGSWPAIIGSMNSTVNVALLPNIDEFVAQFKRLQNSVKLFWTGVPGVYVQGT